MSSVSAATAALAAVDDTVVKAPRKFPSACWAQDETLVLIEAYRERWYELRRGYLRTADWDAVAAAIADRCSDACPTKTSAQCRHKMEKLRQRYRVEKQRSVAYPYPAGRLFSPWVFFSYMEAMENGSKPPPAVQKNENSAYGSRLNSSLDHNNTLELKVTANNDSDSSPDLVVYNGAEAKILDLQTKISKSSPSYLDAGSIDEEAYLDKEVINLRIRKPRELKAKNSGKRHPQAILRARNFVSLADQNNSNGELWPRYGDWYGIHLNRSSISKAGAMKQMGDTVEEMVASIRLLGEGFVKTEQAKMEMAREMEGMRMKMELKRNETILQSQKQILEAFAKGLFEMKRIKKLRASFADSTEL